jgi:cell division protein FtsL
VAFVRALPDQPLLDRLVRGRGWIALLAALLVVIVAMQVSLLGLGASIGRAVQQATALQAQNEQLRARVGTLADDQRIESLAAGMGMVMPAPTAVTFLSAGSSTTPGDAATAISAPDPAAFAARQQASSQVAPPPSAVAPAVSPVGVAAAPASTAADTRQSASTAMTAPAAAQQTSSGG